MHLTLRIDQIRCLADGLDQLESHASFLMLEFTAALLAEMERWMLTASPAMIDLSTFADTSDKFLGPSSMFGDMQKRFPAPADEASTLQSQAVYGFLLLSSRRDGSFAFVKGSRKHMHMFRADEVHLCLKVYTKYVVNPIACEIEQS